MGFGKHGKLQSRGAQRFVLANEQALAAEDSRDPAFSDGSGGRATIPTQQQPQTGHGTVQ